MISHAKESPTDFPEHSREKGSFVSLWDLATLYRNDRNPLLQEFKLRGRYHGQYHRVDSDRGGADGWEDRRSRFGFDASLFERKVEVRADFQSDDGFGEIYNGLVDAYVKWKPAPEVSITAGRTKPRIGYYDFLRSTNEQATFERSQIFNQLRVDRVTGLIAEGKARSFTWQTGIYSNDVDREFGAFRGAFSFGAGIGYDAAAVTGWEKADFRLDWLHSGHDADDALFDRYDDLVSVTFWGGNGPWRWAVEGFYGTGGGGRFDDVFGCYIQPTFDLNEKVQLVARYSFATGSGGASLDGQSRYEREAPDLAPAGTARGDAYHAFYLGAQYFIHGDQLKLMAGGEYATLSGGSRADDYEGFTFLTGIRFSF